MARVLSTATVLGLLAASAVAFALTEGAKLTRSPIGGTQVTKVFSPHAAKAGDRLAHISFKLRTPERLSVWIEDAHGDRVRTLLHPRSEPRGARVDLVWDAFADNGLLAPDGVYHPVVDLRTSHLITTLPNPIQIDTKPPVISVPKPLQPVLSPDDDRYGDLFRVHYRVNEPAHGILFVRVRGKQQRVAFTQGKKQFGVLVWNGKVDGEPVRPGAYLLSVAAQDTAKNVSKPYPFANATVRYVALGRHRVTVKPGARFAIRVSTDAPTVRWKLRGRTGVARRGTLHLRAPHSAGVFFLYVFVDGHAARCAVVVA